MWVSSLCTVIAAWLNASRRSRVGLGINRSARVQSTLSDTNYRIPREIRYSNLFVISVETEYFISRSSKSELSINVLTTRDVETKPVNISHRQMAGCRPDIHTASQPGSQTYLLASLHDDSYPRDEIGRLLSYFGWLVVKSPEDGTTDLRKVWLDSLGQGIDDSPKAIEHDNILEDTMTRSDGQTNTWGAQVTYRYSEIAQQPFYY